MSDIDRNPYYSLPERLRFHGRHASETEDHMARRKYQERKEAADEIERLQGELAKAHSLASQMFSYQRDLEIAKAKAEAEIERLQAAKRAALAIADERSKENVGLRADIEKLNYEIAIGTQENGRLRAENVGLRAEVEWLNERIDKLAPGS